MSWWLEMANSRPASPLRGGQAPSPSFGSPRGVAPQGGEGVQLVHLPDGVTLTPTQQCERGWRANGVRETRRGEPSWPAAPRGESSNCSPAQAARGDGPPTGGGGHGYPLQGGVYSHSLKHTDRVEGEVGTRQGEPDVGWLHPRGGIKRRSPSTSSPEKSPSEGV